MWLTMGAFSLHAQTSPVVTVMGETFVEKDIADVYHEVKNVKMRTSALVGFTEKKLIAAEC